MPQKKLKCSPKKLCQGASCCKDPTTDPSLSLGDYIRISDTTGESIGKIWREKGNASVSSQRGMPMGEFIVTLGLLHDPCPYLSEDYRCKVYSARPLGCAVFPLHLLIDSSPQLKTNYKGYQCIRDVSLSEGQKRLGQELRILLRESAEIDFEFFWKKEPIYISTQTTADYFSLASQAIEAQMSLGRNKNHPRVKKMLQAVFEMQRIVDTREVLNGFAPDSYRALLSPVVYCLLEKEIADRMKVVDKSAIDAYRKIDQRWYELSREAH